MCVCVCDTITVHDGRKLKIENFRSVYYLFVILLSNNDDAATDDDNDVDDE